MVASKGDPEEIRRRIFELMSLVDEWHAGQMIGTDQGSGEEAGRAHLSHLKPLTCS